MRKLIRIFVGAALLAAVAFVAPSPASADHAGTPVAVPADPHEAPPSVAVVAPVLPCVVQGEVLPGNAADVGQKHFDPVTGTAIPGLDATHSHYEFVSSTITCPDTPLSTVTADGGNDGHIVDMQDLSVPHAEDEHHGSTNESGWSHSALYSGGADADRTTESNDCDNVDNRNKGDITVATELPSKGWVKYLRVGTALYVWGCFLEGDLSAAEGGLSPFFSATLAIASPAPSGIGNLPDCLIPEVGGVTPDPPPCGFSIAGTAYRGPMWAADAA